VKNLFLCQTNDKHALDLARHFRCLILSFSIGGLLFCLMVITVNPVVVTSDNSGQECLSSLFLCRVHREMGSDQVHHCNKRTQESARLPSYVKFCALILNIC
jgi:hypothetical protein